MQLTKLRDVPSVFYRVLVLICIAFALAMALAPMQGCVAPPRPKPQCPLAKVHPIQDRNGDWYYIFDQKNVDVVGQMLTGLKKGECEAGEFWATDARIE